MSIGVNNSQAGKVSGLDSVYTVGDEVTITATTNPGYTFVGWYDGEKLLSKEYSYSFKMPSISKYYEARYSKVTLQVDYSNAGTVSELTGRYIPGDEVTTTLLPSKGAPQAPQNLSVTCNTPPHFAHFNSIPLTPFGFDIGVCPGILA